MKVLLGRRHIQFNFVQQNESNKSAGDELTQICPNIQKIEEFRLKLSKSRGVKQQKLWSS